MQPLPSFLALFIDSLGVEEPDQDAREESQTWLRSIKQQFARDSEYAVNEKEREFLSFLDSTIEALHAHLHQAAPDQEQLLTSAQQFSALWSELEDARAAKQFPHQAATEDLLRACGSGIEGSPLLDRIRLSEEELELVESETRDVRGRLPQPLQQKLLGAFAAQRADLQALIQDSERQQLSRRIAERAGWLEELFPSQEAVTEREFVVPVIGEFLSSLRHSTDPGPLEQLKKTGLPQLWEVWQNCQDGWLLPISIAEKHLDQTENLIERFEGELNQYPENQAVFWSAVKELDQAFRLILHHRMPVEDVLDSPLGPEAALLLGLLQEEAAHESAEHAIEGIRAGDVPPFLNTYADALEEFLDTGDKSVLLEQLEQLLMVTRGHANRSG